LDDLGLRDAVESHLEEFQQRTDIEIDEQLSFQSSEVTSEVADNAYRLLQESLSNVLKHAAASKVTVQMDVDKTQATPMFRMTVSDNGRGYATTEIENETLQRELGSDATRLGLIGMKERVDLLGGQIRIESTVNVGTSIQIELPLRQRPFYPTERRNVT
jgi:signal transduction histidine kinase